MPTTMTVISDDMEDRVLGCLLGGALGDAAGFPFEGKPPGPREIQPSLFKLSDDTQLTLATCASILHTGSVEPAGIALHFLLYYRGNKLSGIGASTLQALQGLDVGGHWASVGRKGEFAAGNGAAIRIAPLAFLIDPTDYFARKSIRDVAWITHHSDEAYAGALAIALAIWMAWTNTWSHGASSPTLAALVAEHLPDSQVRDRLHHLAQWDDDASFEEVLVETGTSGFVVESVPAAIAAAQAACKLGFEKTLAQLLCVGGDTDSIGSMAGQIYGARFGVNGLPGELIAQIPGVDEILPIAKGISGLVNRNTLF